MQRMQRCLLLVGVCGIALAFGPCAPTYADLTRMIQGIGDDVIATGSERFFDFPALNNGVMTTAGNSDWDRWVRLPATAFLQAAWRNWVDYNVPQDPADALRSGALVRK